MQSSPTELQRSPEESTSDLLKAMGLSPEAEEKPKAKKPKESEPVQDEALEDDDKEEVKEVKPKAKASKAILDDEDDVESSSDEDEDDEGEDKGKTAGQLYKEREKRRKLKAEKESVEKERDELREKLKGAVSVPAGDIFTGTYANVKTPEDLEKAKSILSQWEEWYDDRTEGFTDNDGNEVDSQTVKKALRDIRKELKRSGDVEKYFDTKDKSAAKAKDLYPFVSDTSSKRHDKVLDLAKSYPEVARSPHAPLLLGRLAVADLVESGEYVLVKKGTAKKAEPVALKTEEKPVQRSLNRPSQQERSETKAPPDTQSVYARIMRGDMDSATSHFASILG
jgi:hypothetical protein